MLLVIPFDNNAKFIEVKIIIKIESSNGYLKLEMGFVKRYFASAPH
jgi:hypothetical protein